MDAIYMPVFHKTVSLLGRGYTFRFQVLHLRKVITEHGNKKTDEKWFQKTDNLAKMHVTQLRGNMYEAG